MLPLAQSKKFCAKQRAGFRAPLRSILGSRRFRRGPAGRAKSVFQAILQIACREAARIGADDRVAARKDFEILSLALGLIALAARLGRPRSSSISIYGDSLASEAKLANNVEAHHSPQQVRHCWVGIQMTKHG